VRRWVGGLFAGETRDTILVRVRRVIELSGPADCVRGRVETRKIAGESRNIVLC
jgi:hypothetical protein